MRTIVGVMGSGDDSDAVLLAAAQAIPHVRTILGERAH